MKQKLFLTSALAMGVIAPAMAETFPTDGYMKENKTYDNAATETNMDGVYEGSVNAVAEYDTIDYILSAGKYLPADSETITTCPAGSFCAGGETVQYNQSSAQGIETCPTGYDSSADGSSSNTQCYRACDINNMGTNGSISSIAHATAISGNDYFGSGTDTCEPTSCENGWHVKAGQSIGGTLYRSIPNVFQNRVSTFAWVDANGSFSEFWDSPDTHDKSFYGIANNDVKVWSVYYGSGIGVVRGKGVCSTHSNSGSSLWQMGMYYYYDNTNQSNAITDETGQAGANNCWCQIDGYMPDGGILQNLKSSSWWLVNKYGAPSECANGCASYCGGVMAGNFGNGNTDAFVEQLCYAIAPGLATCEANTITINWTDVDPEYAGQNNEGTATYGSDVRTPVKAQTIKGKTFKGWRFSKPEQTNLPE